MAPEAEPVDAVREGGDERATPRVTVHEIRPDRVVFTETGNTDAWISTDLTVDPTQ